MIKKKLLEHNEKLEKDKKIKEFVKKKLVIQNELLKTYEMARMEEERKVDGNRHRNQRYQEWKDNTKIVSSSEMKEY
jgi:hypothetical protein